MEPDPELDFMRSKLIRSKSRKSFRKKRDQEPYKLLRKGRIYVNGKLKSRKWNISNILNGLTEATSEI